VDCGDFILGAAPRPLKRGLARIAAILACYTDRRRGKLLERAGWPEIMVVWQDLDAVVGFVGQPGGKDAARQGVLRSLQARSSTVFDGFEL